MTQHEDYVSPEQAAVLKQSGFDWPTQAYYASDSAPGEQKWLEVGVHTANHNSRPDLTSAPTLAQAQKWLREVKDCIIVVYPSADFYDCNDVVMPFLDGKWFFELWIKAERISLEETASVDYLTYEAALSAGITAALKLINPKIKKLWNDKLNSAAKTAGQASGSTVTCSHPLPDAES